MGLCVCVQLAVFQCISEGRVLFHFWLGVGRGVQWVIVHSWVNGRIEVLVSSGMIWRIEGTGSQLSELENWGYWFTVEWTGELRVLVQYRSWLSELENWGYWFTAQWTGELRVLVHGWVNCRIEGTTSSQSSDLWQCDLSHVRVLVHSWVNWGSRAQRENSILGWTFSPGYCSTVNRDSVTAEWTGEVRVLLHSWVNRGSRLRGQRGYSLHVSQFGRVVMR